MITGQLPSKGDSTSEAPPPPGIRVARTTNMFRATAPGMGYHQVQKKGRLFHGVRAVSHNNTITKITAEKQINDRCQPYPYFRCRILTGNVTDMLNFFIFVTGKAKIRNLCIPLYKRACSFFWSGYIFYSQSKPIFNLPKGCNYFFLLFDHAICPELIL